MSDGKKPRTFEEYFNAYLQRQIEFSHWLKKQILDQTESPIEAIAYLQLYIFAQAYGCTNGCNEGEHVINFKPQVKIGEYRVDFLVEYKDKKVVIECDGHEFHEKTKDQVVRDKKRDRYLSTKGYSVLRYTGSEICKRPRVISDDLFKMLFRDEFPDLNEMHTY